MILHRPLIDPLAQGWQGLQGQDGGDRHADQQLNE
jgi:hypothetical protein